jgi:transposase
VVARQYLPRGAVSEVASFLRKRFFIRDIILVCDRGMVSAKNLKKFTALGFKYIVGMKMRKMRHIKTKVIGRRGRYSEIRDNLEVKEVNVQNRRYILCYNPLEAERDREKRETILKNLREKFARGEVRGLIGNRGYRTYLKVQKEAIHIDEMKVQREARFDGKYVLRTNTDLPKEKVALTYKGLYEIEALFRDLKDILEARPFFHQREDMIKAQHLACFLSLQLMVELKKQMVPENISLPWKEIILLLSEVSAVKVKVQDKEFLLRTQFPTGANDIFKAVGVRPPPLAQLLPRQGKADAKRREGSPRVTQLSFL